MILSVKRKPTSLAGSQLFGWANYDNILVNDGTTSKSKLTGQNTNVPYLKLSAFDNPIPDDANIVGVKVLVTAKNELPIYNGFCAMGTSPVTGQGGIRLLNVDGVVGKGMTPLKGSALETKEIGGDTDLWGATSISTEQLNDPSFGIYASFRNIYTTAQSMFLDCIEVEVFYTLPEPDPMTGGGTLPPNNP